MGILKRIWEYIQIVYKKLFNKRQFSICEMIQNLLQFKKKNIRGKINAG